MSLAIVLGFVVSDFLLVAVFLPGHHADWVGGAVPGQRFSKPETGPPGAKLLVAARTQSENSLPNMSANSENRPAVTGPRWKRLLQNLALSGMVFLLCIATFEVGLRFCGYGNLEIYEFDPKLYWKLKPNQDCYTKIGHKPVHINSQGTRGPEFQMEKPANTIRILSLGDSRTFGWGLSDAETYSRRLEQSLQNCVGPGKKVEVINAGVNAWSYSQMLVYFRDFGLRYQPDFVILGDANVWTQFSEKNSPDFVKSFIWRVRLKNILRRFAIYHFVVEVEL